MKKVELSVIIPVLNEAENLPELYERLLKTGRALNLSWEIIFVDDGSSDGSLAILKKIAGKDFLVKLIQFRRNFGQTAALSAGIDHAQGDIIVTLDADLENDPADIPRLINELNKGFDVVSGWRKNRWADKVISRRLTSKAANWLIFKISGLKLHDFGCTLKAYRADVIKNINLYGNMHRFIPALVYWQGARVREIEINYQPRRFGQSKYGMGRISRVLLDLVTLKFLSGYATKPIYFFGKLGFVSLFLGLLTFIWAIYYKVSGQKSFVATPLPIVIVLFVVLAVLLVLIGLLAEMVMRTYHESRGRKIYSIKEKINH